MTTKTQESSARPTVSLDDFADGDLLDTVQVAEILRCSKSHLHAMLHGGEFEAVVCLSPRVYRIEAGVLRRFIEQKRRSAAEHARVVQERKARLGKLAPRRGRAHNATEKSRKATAR